VILALVDETRDMTLDGLRAALADQGLEFGYGTLWRFFDRRGITLKKDSACGRARAPRCRKARQAWFDRELDLDPDRLEIALSQKTRKLEDIGRRSSQDGVAGCWNPATSLTKCSGSLAFVFVVFGVIFVFVVLFVLRRVEFRALEHGKRKRLAKQIAFAAHPETLDGITLDRRNRHRMTAGFQHHDVALFQIHGLIPHVESRLLHDTAR
jgi:hypothetical protein